VTDQSAGIPVICQGRSMICQDISIQDDAEVLYHRRGRFVRRRESDRGNWYSRVGFATSESNPSARSVALPVRAIRTGAHTVGCE
jgi:hypothetical protein